MGAVASITIHRQAVTLPVYSSATPSTPPAAASILAEIAERLEELDEHKFELAADTIIRLAGIANRSRRAFRITVQLLHGNLTPILSSYQDQAAKRNVTKQDIHYEFAHEIEAIRPFYPELYNTILAMRRQATQHEDPIAKNEVASAGGTSQE